MKAIILAFFTGFFLHASAQKASMTDNALKEISSIIEHAYSFLGKTDSTILANGRPASLKGCDKWQVEFFDPKGNSSTEISKMILVGTGCGSLMIAFSRKTNLASSLTFIAHKKAKLYGIDIHKHLKDRYSFNEKSAAIVEIKGHGFIEVGILSGGVLMYALNDDKTSMKFD